MPGLVLSATCRREDEKTAKRAASCHSRRPNPIALAARRRRFIDGGSSSVFQLEGRSVPVTAARIICGLGFATGGRFHAAMRKISITRRVRRRPNRRPRPENNGISGLVIDAAASRRGDCIMRRPMAFAARLLAAGCFRELNSGSLVARRVAIQLNRKTARVRRRPSARNQRVCG